jgi:CBS domain-containing protein
MKVRDVMKSDPVICGVFDSLYDCARTMYERNVGYLVVLDDSDRCVGVISDRDIVCDAVASDFDLKTTPVTEIMERDFKFVYSDLPVVECLRVMRAEGLRRIPVLERNRIAGIITIDDLIIKKLCSIDDVAAILRRQLSDPGAQHRYEAA